MDSHPIKKSIVILIAISLVLQFIPLNSLANPLDYDLVIKGGRIFNPSTGHELEGYNIGIKGEKIVRITKEDLAGQEEIDAQGLYVSPGFIDLISYDPNPVGIRLKVLDGVTSNLAMHGGTDDAESWYESWLRRGVITNFGASSFITRLRWPLVGYEIDREMTDPGDIEKLVEATRKNIEAGALGISFSFEYVPGIKHEIVPLLELAAEYGVPTFYHLRYSDKDNGLKGIEEVIEYGEETNAAIHIMHINSTGGTFHMEEALDMLAQARDRGLDISACVYPYDYWATYIDSARFRPGWQDRYNIDYGDLQIGGTDTRITRENFNYYRQQHLLVAALGSMPEEELIMCLEDPHIMIGSDTIIVDGNNHPRGAGTYGKLFGEYVREKQVLSTMEAIEKASYLPAKRMEAVAPQMAYKGRIEINSDADLTIFDPDIIKDQSTVKDTSKPTLGVEYVIINGVIVKKPHGLVPDLYPGQPIKSYFIHKIPEEETVDFKLKFNQEEEVDLADLYTIDGRIFAPLEEVFQPLNIPINSNREGEILLGQDIRIEIGNRKAQVQDQEVVLNSEPIIYKGNTYMDIGDLARLLSQNYQVSLKEGLVEVEEVPLEEKEPAEEEVLEDEEVVGKNKAARPAVYLMALLGLVLLLAIHGRKVK